MQDDLHRVDHWGWFVGWLHQQTSHLCPIPVLRWGVCESRLSVVLNVCKVEEYPNMAELSSQVATFEFSVILSNQPCCKSWCNVDAAITQNSSWGCGTGLFSKFLSDAENMKIIGVDLSEGHLQLARQHMEVPGTAGWKIGLPQEALVDLGTEALSHWHVWYCWGCTCPRSSETTLWQCVLTTDLTAVWFCRFILCAMPALPMPLLHVDSLVALVHCSILRFYADVHVYLCIYIYIPFEISFTFW